MIPLVIEDNVRAEIQRVKDHAEMNVIPLETVRRLMAGEPLPLPGDLEQFTLFVPMAFKVVYSHEEQTHGVCRHLSMSVDAEDRLPHPAAIQIVCKEFGFINELDHCIIWPERFEGSLDAINVLEPLDGNFEPFKKQGES